MSQESSTLTIVVAIYGAVVSSLVAGWNIYRELTNRGRLRVRVTLANMVAPGVGMLAKDRLWYKVTNVGRQPIWLSQIGGRHGTQNFLIVVAQSLPIKLEPGETFDDAAADAHELLDQHLEGPDRIMFLGAWATVGKVHKMPRRELKALLGQVRDKRERPGV